MLFERLAFQRSWMIRLMNTFIKNCVCLNTYAALKISIMTVLLSPAGQLFSALFFHLLWVKLLLFSSPSHECCSKNCTGDFLVLFLARFSNEKSILYLAKRWGWAKPSQVSSIVTFSSKLILTPHLAFYICWNMVSIMVLEDFHLL